MGNWIDWFGCLSFGTKLITCMFSISSTAIVNQGSAIVTIGFTEISFCSGKKNWTKHAALYWITSILTMSYYLPLFTVFRRLRTLCCFKASWTAFLKWFACCRRFVRKWTSMAATCKEKQFNLVNLLILMVTFNLSSCTIQCISYIWVLAVNYSEPRSDGAGRRVQLIILFWVTDPVVGKICCALNLFFLNCLIAIPTFLRFWIMIINFNKGKEIVWIKMLFKPNINSVKKTVDTTLLSWERRKRMICLLWY